MILKRIKIKNFKSIYQELEIDFEQVNGFWKIEGPVGAGKTTIGEAIIFGLFGDVKGKNIIDLISWGERKGVVIIDCETRGHQLHIDRVIKGDLNVLVDGEPLVFTNKRDAQAQLEEEYYDISKMTLELLCIISFNNFKSLSNMTASDSRAFLDQVFGFSLLTQYADSCKIKRKEVYDQIVCKEHERNNIAAQIKKIEDLSNFEKIEGNLSEVNQQILDNKRDKENFQSEMMKKNREENSSIQEKQNELTRIKTLGANKAKEIKFIEQGTCPTCGAPIDQSQLEIKKQERQAFLAQYRTVEAQLKQLTDIYNQHQQEYKVQLQVYTDRNTELVSLKTKLEEQQRRLGINTTEIKQLKKKQSQVEQVIKTLNKDQEEWDQLFDIVSVSMRQQILGSFIPMLNNSIQEYTRRLQLPYIIEFDNQFKCSIRIYGMDKQINISSLSTGQLKTIDMCVILGVLKVIFSGVHFNVMFLDELFSNMDADLRSMICTILKNELKQNQTIFIISHTEISDTVFNGAIIASLNYSNNLKKSTYEIKTFYS